MKYNATMSAQGQSVLRQALGLTLRERAEVAVELLASLDGDADPEAEAAWAAEIERRARRARDGATKGTAWSTVRDRIKRRLQDQ